MNTEELYKLSLSHPILFFDGVCNLCNWFVQFVIRHDKKGVFRFCPLQEVGGEKIRKDLNLGNDINTAVGLFQNKTYTHSDVLKMAAMVLGGKWILIRPLYLLPKSFRDLVYNWVARNRYQWFGKSDQCMVPQPHLMKRFIR